MSSRSPRMRSVQYHRPTISHVNADSVSGSLTPTNARIRDHEQHHSFSSEEADTVVRWQTPPESRSPTPQQAPRYSYIPQAYRTAEADAEREPLHPQAVVRFDEDQIRSTQAEAEGRENNMAEQLEELPPTPTADDTPYIRFAIEQLTIDEDMSTKRVSQQSSQPPATPVLRLPPDTGFNHVSPEREREAMRLVRKHRSTPSGDGRLFNFNATQPLPRPSEPEIPAPITPRISAIFIPVDSSLDARHPPLTFVPTVLRPLSMITLAFLCLAMTAAIIFCAIYSTKHNGLYEWKAGLYGGRYFIFRFLPQVLAAIILVHVQAVTGAMTRILPFTMMANEQAEHRTNALFLGIFPRSLLFPRWEGPLSFEIANSVLWLSVFTIPLTSSLFSVTLVEEDIFRWTTVQGVAWVLVGIYVLIFVVTILFGVFFFRRTTGLLWDPVSLADIMSMLPRSNCFNDYVGTDVMKGKNELKDRLASRADRLGYWRTQNKNQGMFYCLGENGAANRRRTMAQSQLLNNLIETDRMIDLEKRGTDFHSARFRNLPWMIRDTFVVLWAVAGVIFLTALLVVSFLPRTAIKNGFPSTINPVPNSTGFSAATFLWSFVPSVIAMLLYIGFQSLDMAFRRRQAWADLANEEGATAAKSLLLDYPSRQLFSCTFVALKNGHHRVALLSLLSTLFMVLPILAGGLFFPLTTSGLAVRIYPNLNVYYIIIALLVLYVIGLIATIPYRKQMALPHDVSCIAEIISFVYGSGVLEDAPFRAPKSKEDLIMRLNAVGARGEGKTFGFGIIRDKRGKEVLNVDRLGRPGNNLIVLYPKNR